MMRAQIVLSTYNGEKFLAEQLRSLTLQSETSWVCLVRDDGSSDRTPTIIESFAQRDSRFKIIKDEKKQIGPCQSFATLLAQCSTDAPIFFCDQDDFWHPDKLKIFLSHLNPSSPTVTPLLVASDLALTDSKLRTTSASMMSSLEYQASSVAFENFLGQNIFPGCAMAFQPSLLKLILPIPQGVPMHDWWTALIASAYGPVKFIPEPLIYYRQHQSQASGGSGSANLAAKAYRAILDPNKNLGYLTKMRFQLWSRLAQRLSTFSPHSDFAREFSHWFHTVPTQGRISAVLAVLKAKIRMQGLIRNLLFTFGVFLFFNEWRELSRKS